MYFIVFHLIALTYAKYLELPFSREAKSFFFVSLILALSILPAMQYDVGADYFNYISIVENPESNELFFRKGEYAFYYLVRTIYWLGIDAQILFVFTSLIMSLLIVNIIRKLSLNGFSPFLMTFLFLFATVMFHNQLNIIRTYLAVYCFLNALCYKAEGKRWKAFLFGVFGLLWHQTMIVAFVLLLVPKALHNKVLKSPVLVYIGFSFIFISGLPYHFLEQLVDLIVPFYSHYLGSTEPSSLLNIMSKLYYFPLHIAFLYLFSTRRIKLATDMERIFVSFWIVFANFYFLFLYWEHFFRFYHYLSFFTVIPIYFLLQYYKRKPLELTLIALFVIFPYLVKVLAVPQGEYLYEFFILNY